MPSLVLFVADTGHQQHGRDVPAARADRQRTRSAKCVHGGILPNSNDPVYGRIELAEQPPDGKLRKASEGWK